MKRYIRTLSAFLSLIMMVPLVGCAGDPVDTTAPADTTSAPADTEFTPDETEAVIADTTVEETVSVDQPSEWDVIRAKAKNEGIKILFIGDSLTHYNEMPQIFAALCKAAKI